MIATVYTGRSCIWCERVKELLRENNYTIEEIPIDKDKIEEFKTKYNKEIKTVPQVIIENNLVGGYHEVEALMKGPTSINKV